MSILYELSLKGLGEAEQYVDVVRQYLNTHTETKIQKDTNETGLVIFNNLMTIYFDKEIMDLDYVKKYYDFDADVVFDFYFFNERYEEGVDVLLQMVAYLETLGIEYLFEEDVEVFRKEKGVLSVNPKRYEEGDYLNRETIRRFLK
ncbi:MAG TPA: hypothetical protein GX717_07900 [Clostridiaceae bacterium]|nr:hypothetical protein [Clostridiaceae bacterium]